MERRFLAAAIIVLLLVMLYLSTISETIIEIPTVDRNRSEQPSEEFVELISENVSFNATKVWGEAAVKVPAVDEEGKGVVTWLTVEIMPGKGRTLVNINQLLFWVDTQYSIQTAKTVAENYTKTDLSKIDIVYAIDTEAYLVEGASAGAALTIATVAVLRNETANQNVMVTGTINPDGSIGPVGGIIAKAKASKDVGATIFLVPEGQSEQIYYRQERECERIGPITYCTTNYVPERVDIEEQVGIDIEEVSTVEDALKYFIE